MPCCIKKWDSDKAKEMRKQCLEDNNEENYNQTYEKEAINNLKIMSKETIPLKPFRYGFLPDKVRELLNISCKSKKHSGCLLHYFHQKLNHHLPLPD